MTKDEMQRLLDRQLQDGATEYAAMKYLIDIMGLTLRKPVQGEDPEDRKK